MLRLTRREGASGEHISSPRTHGPSGPGTVCASPTRPKFHCRRNRACNEAPLSSAQDGIQRENRGLILAYETEKENVPVLLETSLNDTANVAGASCICGQMHET